MSEIWSINLEQLLTKDIKMYEDEAKALLAEYEKQLAEAVENEDDLKRSMYYHAKHWVDAQTAVRALEQKIEGLKCKMDIDQEEEDDS